MPAEITRITPKWIYTEHTVLKIFSLFRILSKLRLPWKTEFALKIFTVLNIFLTIQDFEQLCAYPEKQGLPWIFHCIEIFCIFQDFWATCACPEKQCTLKIFTVLNIQYFIHSGFLSNLFLPWKQSVPWNFNCIEIFFIFHDFWETCAYPENRVCPANFHCIEYNFCIHDFWATCAALKNRVCPEFTVLNIYFLSFKILSNLLLPWTEFALNRVCPEIFKSGGLPLPPFPRLVRHCSPLKVSGKSFV